MRVWQFDFFWVLGFLISFLFSPHVQAKKEFEFSEKKMKCINFRKEEGLNPAISKGVKGYWGTCIDLSGKELNKFYKGRMRQKHLDLRGSNLERCDLTGLVLDHTNLSYTNLQNANFNGVTLINVNFTGADLRGAEGIDIISIEQNRDNLNNVIIDKYTYIREKTDEDRKIFLDISRGILKLGDEILSAVFWKSKDR